MLRFSSFFLVFTLAFTAPVFAQEDDAFPEEPPKEVLDLPDVDELLENGAKIDDEESAPESEATETKPEKDIDEPDVQPDLQQDLKTHKAAKKLLKTVSRFVDSAAEETKQIADSIRRRVSSAQTLNLEPVSSNEAWKTSVVLLRAKKCSNALKKANIALEQEPTLRKSRDVQFAMAKMLSCSGKKSEAKNTFKQLAKGSDGAAAASKLELGTSRQKLQPGETLSTYLKNIEKLPVSKSTDALAQLATLRRDATTSSERRRIDLARATILEQKGDLPAAKKAYMKLYRSTLGRRFNDTVESRIRKFEKKHGQKVLSYGENIDLMRKLIMRGKYKDARQVSVANAKRRRVKGNEIKGWSFFRQALEAEHKKDRKQAASLFAKAEKLVRDSEVRPRLYFGWARALRRLNQDSKAIALYERLCVEYSKHHLCDNALYESGRLLQYANQHKQAIEKFNQVLKRFPDADHAADAVWRRGFSYYLDKEYSHAKKDFETLREKYGHFTDASELSLGLKASYWIATSTLKAGDVPGAKKAFHTAYSNGPLTWYGRLAAARLSELGDPRLQNAVFPEVKTADLEDFRTLVVPAHPRLEAAAALTRIGLFEDATKWLKREAALHPAPDGTERFLSAMYLRKGRPDMAHWVMKRHIDESGPTADSMRDFAVAFPNDYLGQSAKFGNKVGVSPYLVSAIIRQESGFRPNVKSWAGAIGLMQLMPRTAGYVARVFSKDSKYSLSQLRRPDTNIKLGSMYIRVHTAHANDSIPMALAGYNAGPAPLMRWVKQYGDRELDAFVESITYREARGYVRKVFTSYVRYAAIYGGDVPNVELKVPALRPWGVVPESKKTPKNAPVSKASSLPQTVASR